MIYWRKIEPRLLMPEFVQDLTDVLTADVADWYVTHGFRTMAEQLALWKAYQAGGPKAAPPDPDKAPHMNGLAIDLALDGDPVQPRLQPEWYEGHPSWIRLRSVIDAHPRLHGGWWFGDGDHIERTKWKQFKGWHGSP